jgi:hypothetical protein
LILNLRDIFPKSIFAYEKAFYLPMQMHIDIVLNPKSDFCILRAIGDRATGGLDETPLANTEVGTVRINPLYLTKKNPYT